MPGSFYSSKLSRMCKWGLLPLRCTYLQSSYIFMFFSLFCMYLQIHFFCRKKFCTCMHLVFMVSFSCLPSRWLPWFECYGILFCYFFFLWNERSVMIYFFYVEYVDAHDVFLYACMIEASQTCLCVIHCMYVNSFFLCVCCYTCIYTCKCRV